jgi:3-deoxy-D-manno-octulosonate 8-phosphate phosphatase (KDO 8-P phosphatase)
MQEPQEPENLTESELAPPAPLVAAPPELLILDVDGVLTDNLISLDGEGRERKSFFVPDGTGLHLLRRAGVPVALLSGRRSAVVEARARELAIDHAYSGILDKGPKVDEIIAAIGASAARTVYVGDDWIDLAPMRRVGLPIAVANAIPEVKTAAIAVTSRAGGAGAVREICHWILRARGDWDRIIEEVSR